MNGRIRLAVWLKWILNVLLAACLASAVIMFVLSLLSLGSLHAGHKVGPPFPVSVPVAFTLDPELLTFTAPVFSDTVLTVLETRGSVITTSARPANELIYFLGLFAVSLVLVWELQLFRRILESVIRGEPFHRANAGRIRWIGLIVIGWAVLGPAAQYLWGRWALRLVETTGGHLRPAFELDFSHIWIGLGILVLAEVFRQGATLEEDRSLTI